MVRKKPIAECYKRSKRISIRVTDEEYKTLKNLSIVCYCKSISEFIRNVCIDEFCYQEYLKNHDLILKVSKKNIEDITREWKKQGINLNQLSAFCNKLFLENEYMGNENKCLEEITFVNTAINNYRKENKEIYDTLIAHLSNAFKVSD